MTRWSLLTVFFFCASGVASADELPSNVEAYLTAHYPGWTLSPINRDAERYFKAAGWHGHPNYFSYDFDGDRLDDVAIQIQYPKGPMKEEADLVFLTRGKMQENVLARRPADPVHRSLYFIRPVLIGENITDVRGRPIPHAGCGVELVNYQQEASVFLFDNGTVRKTRTLDLR